MGAKELFAELGKGRIPEAWSHLETWKKLHPQDQLDQNYAEAKIHLFEGNFHKAYALLTSLLRIETQNIAVHCDYILCLYSLNLMTDLENVALPLAEKLDSPDHLYLDEKIFLAKILEELGHTQRAFDLIETARGVLLNPNQQKQLDIQALRLLTELEHFDQARFIYDRILLGKNHDHNFEIEREHALLLADFRFFGITAAMERYAYLQSLDLIPADFSFIRSEMIERIVISNKIELLESIDMDRPCFHEYESIQLELTKQHLAQQKPQISIVRWEKQLTTVCLLRIIHQALILFPNLKNEGIILERFRFHIQALPNKILKTLWAKKLMQLAPMAHYRISLGKQTIEFNSNTLSISSEIIWKILSYHQAKGGSMEVSELIPDLYGQEFSLSLFDRLRMAVSRSNKKFEQAGFPAPLRLTKSHLQLNTRVTYED